MVSVFLQLNTIVNYIDEVYYRFMRNIIGLDKGTPKSRFKLAKKMVVLGIL